MSDIIFPSIDDYLKEFTGFDVDATQISSGNFLCRQRRFYLPKFILGDRFISTALQYQATLLKDCFYIVIPKNNVGMYMNGKKTNFNLPLLFTENQEMLIRTPSNSINFHILISTDELSEYLDEGMIEQLKKISSLQNTGKTIFIQSESNQKYLCTLIENLLNKNELLNYQEVLDAQESILKSLCKLLNLAPEFRKIKHINKPTRLAIVNRALSYIHKDSSLKMTVPEVAEVSFCCARSLEYAFKSILKMTPKQYLIKRRLQLIHSILKNQSDIPISEIVEKFGIVNQGRFAQDYLKFYNEYPHETRGRMSRLKNIESVDLC